jgi:hypothetical protein
MKRATPRSLLLRDPWFLALLDRAVAAHGRTWAPGQIQAFRRQMAFTLETHPGARALLAAERPDLARRLPVNETD